MNEEWKPVEGWEGTYSVSNMGQVRSEARTIIRSNGSPLNLKSKIMANSICSWGYKRIQFDGKSYCIHKLVAQAFINNPDNKPQVNHIDGCKTNNSVDNLEWVTRAENIQHAFATGLHGNRKGSSNANSKLTEFDVKLIRLYNEHYNITDANIAKLFGVSSPSISAIFQGRTWAHV